MRLNQLLNFGANILRNCTLFFLFVYFPAINPCLSFLDIIKNGQSSTYWYFIISLKLELKRLMIKQFAS